MNTRHLLLLGRLALLAALLGSGTIAAGRHPASVGPAPAAPRAPARPAQGTPTPPAEPELAILQYVIAAHPGWMCQGPSGTPGHRQITNCSPYSNFTHPTNGYIDDYTNPNAAQANWSQRRAIAQTMYPSFADTTYNGYAGYQANNTAFPTAHYEEYYWGSRWVLGAISSDDTQFWGGPYVARAIMDAAAALGYLPGGGPTPTVTATRTGTPIATITPTVTPTPPPCCPGLSATGSLYCVTGGFYYEYAFSVSNSCPITVTGTATTYLEVAANQTGPWDIYRQTGPTGQSFAPGQNTLSSLFTPAPIPPPYNWWRVRLHVEYGCPPPLDYATAPLTICPMAPSPTPRPATATPVWTATAIPTPLCCNGLSASGASACIIGNSYDYGLTVNNTCVGALSGSRTIYLELSANATGPWDIYLTNGPSPQVYPPGMTFINGNFGPQQIPAQYSWWRVRLRIDYACLPPVDYATAPRAVCEPRPSATPTSTGTGTPPTWTPTATRTPTRTITPTVTGTPPTPCPITFNDVPPGSTFYDYVQWLACRGTISGYPCGGPGEPCPGAYFRPNNNVTRGQLAKIIANTAQYTETPVSQTFEDVPPPQTFYLWVERIALRNIVAGYQCNNAPGEPCIPPTNRPYYRPNNPTTRGQIAKIVSEARGYSDPPTTQTFEDVPPSNAFYLYAERLTSRGIISGYPCGGPVEPCVAPNNRSYFRPGNPATRGQIAKIVTLAYGGP